MRVAIIGGAGKMGRWFARFLLSEKHEVVISGRSEARLREAKEQLGVLVASNVEAVKGADAIVLSVPINGFEDIVKEIAPHINLAQVVVDVTSIKKMPVDVMHKYLKTKQVLGAHPLFGPGAQSVANQNFILTPTNNEEKALAQKAKDYLEGKGALVTLMTPQEHDRKMAVVLGLAHFIAIVAADALLSTDEIKNAESIGGITYKVLLTLVESVLTEDAELYASLQMNLPNLAELERLFRDKAGEWAHLVATQDRAEFIRRMKALKEKVQKDNPHFGKAYENMYRIAAGR
ncbi:MAG: prephenate dehydrogenase [Chloroflexota bacterium]